MSIDLCIICREDYETGKGAMSALATFLRDEMDRQKLTRLELERRSGVPDATLGRIINDEVNEVKGSVVAQIAKGLGIPFWKLMQIAGHTTDKPGDPDEEIVRIATTLAAQPDLAEMMRDATVLDPEDRDATRVYMADLQRRRLKRRQSRRRRKKTQSGEEGQ